MFEAEGHAVGVIARTADVVHDAQMRRVGALVPGDGIPGTGLTVDSPFHISGEAKVRPQPAPDVGQHSEEVLREVGYSTEEIERLHRGGVVG